MSESARPIPTKELANANSASHMAPTRFERSDNQLSGSWIGRAERQEELLKVWIGRAGFSAGLVLLAAIAGIWAAVRSESR